MSSFDQRVTGKIAFEGFRALWTCLPPDSAASADVFPSHWRSHFGCQAQKVCLRLPSDSAASAGVGSALAWTERRPAMDTWKMAMEA
eukprot:1157893-Pelagomonas_calceolata.AAC.3